MLAQKYEEGRFRVPLNKKTSLEDLAATYSPVS